MKQTEIKHLQFVDAQAMRILHKGTFDAPEQAQLDALAIGDSVKVCADNIERFWVTVTQIKGRAVTGTIDNELVIVDARYGDSITFDKTNIYDILKGEYPNA